MPETETEALTTEAQSENDRGQFPPGYDYNSEVLADVDEQIAGAWADYDYQAAQVPSTEDLPIVDITPTFNPTEVPDDQVYVGAYEIMGDLGPYAFGPHRSLSGSTEPVVAWRIVEKARLQDGSGITSSKVLGGEGVTSLDKSDIRKHMASNQASRVDEAETPFVSFTTDPEMFADFIERHQFGTGEGQDSVVIRALVEPDRVLSNGSNKAHEVLLLGGLAPNEYQAAYEVDDFITAMSPAAA